ncbi:MAG: sodium:calcium antiporter [Euryarchaeota archaeon]|nr:sodium:calcium antiporter [Euryarchaeota archaeon]
MAVFTDVVFWLGISAVGLLLLNEGAKFITDYATLFSKKTGQSMFIVGMFLVSGLSVLPEILVSLLALRDGNNDLAMANALVSNIVTISFLVGVSAVLSPLRVSREVILRDAVFLLTFTFIATALLLDGDLTRFDGIVLLVMFVPYVVNLLTARQTVPAEELRLTLRDIEVELKVMGRLFDRRITLRVGPQWFVVGLALAFIGAEVVIRGGVTTATLLGISPWFIGATLFAIGTSLPDMAAVYHSTTRGHADMALGLGIGANIFSIILNLGLMGVVYPSSYDLTRLVPALAFMVLSTILLVWFMITGAKVSRREGTVLVSLFFVYLVVDYVYSTYFPHFF